MFETIISDSLEEGFTLGNNWKVIYAMGNTTVPCDCLFQSGGIHKRHEFSHEIKFDNDL